jgi:hypothetical protein
MRLRKELFPAFPARNQTVVPFLGATDQIVHRIGRARVAPVLIGVIPGLLAAETKHRGLHEAKIIDVTLLDASAPADARVTSGVEPTAVRALGILKKIRALFREYCESEIGSCI